MIFIIKFTEIFLTLSAAFSPDSGYKNKLLITVGRVETAAGV